MNRRKSREQAFIFIFESTFGFQETEEIIKNAEAAREEKLSDFARSLFEGVIENQGKIDDFMEQNLNGWKKDRLSRTTLSILRLGIFEIMFAQEEVPVSVCINEAVELAKKYSTKEEASYINGVLGSVSKNAAKENL